MIIHFWIIKNAFGGYEKNIFCRRILFGSIIWKLDFGLHYGHFVKSVWISGGARIKILWRSEKISTSNVFQFLTKQISTKTTTKILAFYSQRKSKIKTHFSKLIIHQNGTKVVTRPIYQTGNQRIFKCRKSYYCNEMNFIATFLSMNIIVESERKSYSIFVPKSGFDNLNYRKRLFCCCGRKKEELAQEWILDNSHTYWDFGAEDFYFHQHKNWKFFFNQYQWIKLFIELVNRVHVVNYRSFHRHRDINQLTNLY